MTGTPISPAAIGPAGRERTGFRLLVLDIDGTLVTARNTIGPAVRRALSDARAAGVALAIATGRLYTSALPLYRAIGASAPLICFHGALIRDPHTATVFRHWPLPQPLAAELLDHLRRRPWRERVTVHFHCQDRLYVSELDPLTRAYLENSVVRASGVGDLRKLAHLAPTKLAMLSPDAALIDALEVDLRQRFGPAELDLKRPLDLCLEAARPGLDKAPAVRYLAEDLLGLKAQRVMAIGDDPGDLAMLEYAGLGVAMGNAPAPVRAAADWVAPPVADDGVAAAIERWLLK